VFVREVLGADRVSVDYTLGTWKVDVPGWQRTSPLMTDVYGTGDYDAASCWKRSATPGLCR